MITLYQLLVDLTVNTIITVIVAILGIFAYLLPEGGNEVILMMTSLDYLLGFASQFTFVFDFGTLFRVIEIMLIFEASVFVWRLVLWGANWIRR